MMEQHENSVICGHCEEGMAWWFAGKTLYITGEGRLGPGWNDPFNGIDEDKVEFVKIDSGCISIECYTFVSWRNLKKVLICDGVRKIGAYAFADCKKLTSIILPDTVEEISECAFKSCEHLKEISLPYSIRKIGCGAFYKCKSLSYIMIPDSVQEIGYGAFAECFELASIQIPEGIRIIEAGVFFKCEALTSIVLPTSVKEIHNSAFAGSGLKGIVIPDSVEFIEDWAFNCCTNLTSITLPHSVIKRRDILYYVNPQNTNFPWTIITPSGSCGENLTWYQSDNTLRFERNLTKEKDLLNYPLSNFIDHIEHDFAQNVEEVENRTFVPRESLSSIALPEDVIEIGDAFNFTGLSEITYPWLITTPVELGEHSFYIDFDSYYVWLFGTTN